MSDNTRFHTTTVPTGEPWNENCYLVVDRIAGDQVIIDPGGRARLICETAEAAGVPVRAILLTHAHHDHVRAAAKVAAHFGVSCHIHSADFALLRKAPSYAIAFGGAPFPPVTAPVALEAADRAPLQADVMRVLHTPGHTPGSTCLLFPGFAFTGDTLLNRTIGRTDLPGCDRAALLASVDRLLAVVRDDDVLYAGHREPWRAWAARAWWAQVRDRAPALDAFEPELA